MCNFHLIPKRLEVASTIDTAEYEIDKEIRENKAPI